MASLFMSGEAVGDASSGDDSASYGDSTDPNEEDGDDKLLERQFHQAADHLQGMVHAASREQLLYLYARNRVPGVEKSKVECNVCKPAKSSRKLLRTL